MKKIVSLFFALIFCFVFGCCAFGAELPERFFMASPDDISAEEAIRFANENNFTGIIADLRNAKSADFAKELLSGGGGISVLVLAEEDLLSRIPAGTVIIAGKDVPEETLLSLAESRGTDGMAFFLPFGDEEALSLAKDYFSKGYFGTVLAENLHSSYAVYGYGEYLSDLSETFSGCGIITLNDLGRVLVPVARGDFFGEQYELNIQYLINRENGFGFCVSDIRDLLEDKAGRASFLIGYFSSGVLDEYADFSVSEKLEVTRPTTETFYVSTDSYTIFGTSDPDEPLFVNDEEIERISESGLFALTTETSEKGRTFTFRNGDATDSVTIIKGSKSSSSSGKTDKLTSMTPSISSVLEKGKTSVTLSCIGPSGGKVTATLNGKTYTLKQVAAAKSGIPAKFSLKVNLSPKCAEDEVTSLGKVKYNLTYEGEKKSFESTAEYYYVGSEAKLAIRANVNLAGVDAESSQSGVYITTLRTGCADYVSEIAETGWYKLSMGGYINPNHCDIITGNTDITCQIEGVSKEKGDNYENLVFRCSEMPAFVGKINEKSLALTLYNTEFCDLSETDPSSDLINRIVAVDNGDGSMTLNIYAKEELWGWDIFPDPENGTFTLMLKPVPKISDDPAKPLSGIKITVCPGHGGIDPGALSVAGEEGVNEAQINLANIMAISEALESLGAEVQRLYTLEGKHDTYDRTDPAREWSCDIYINCHANSIAESSKANLWCGTYIYYHFDHSADFSKKLCDYISSSTKRDNEGAVQDYYSVTRLTLCPAVMMEVGFVSNPRELESLIDPIDIQKTAYATVKAVLETVGR